VGIKFGEFTCIIIIIIIIIIIHFTSLALEGIHKRHSLCEVFTQSHRNLNILSIWQKKAWRMNRFSQKVIIVSRNLDGFS